MKYDLISPCAMCPFRRNMAERFQLHPERVEEILSASTFPCHKTVDYSNDDYEDDGEITADSKQCAGFLILHEHEERPTQMMRIVERLGLYDRTKLDMDANVFECEEEMIEAYEEVY